VAEKKNLLSIAIPRRCARSCANVNLADRNGVTPLQLARSRGYREMAAVLEKR
jgi:hypothetical protein